jgi:hypothetical protein
MQYRAAYPACKLVLETFDELLIPKQPLFAARNVVAKLYRR